MGRRPFTLPKAPAAHRDDQGGFILVTVTLLTVLAMVLVMTAFAAGEATLNGSTQTALTVQASAAAQAGLSAAYHAVDTAGPLNLPCSIPRHQLESTAPAGTPPGPTASYSVTISYYPVPLPLPALSTCAPLNLAALTSLVLPARVVVDSTGRASAGTVSDQQNVEAVLDMTLGAAAGDKYAIFTGSGFSPSNGVTIDGTSGHPADVYVRGAVNCANGVAIDGTVVSTQGMNLANGCTVDGAAWTTGSMQMSNNSGVTGNVTVATGSGTGNVTFTNSASVGGDVRAGGNVTFSNSASVVGNLSAGGNVTFANSASVGGNVLTGGNVTQPGTGGWSGNIGGTSTEGASPPPQPLPPPVIPFPTLTLHASAWQSAGYSVVTNDDCNYWSRKWGGDTASFYYALWHSSTNTTKEVLQTTCPISLYNNQQIAIDHSLAIFDSGGFNLSNNANFASTTSNPHNLYLIVPSPKSATPPSCQANINLSNNAVIQPPLVAFIYTPCAIHTSNSTSFSGQVVAGAFTLANGFSLNYHPMGPVPGLSFSSTTTVAAGYSLSLVNQCAQATSGSCPSSP